MKSGITSFKPSCHIKVNPPAAPKVNFTSVSWLSQVHKHERISSYRSEVQWKKQDQSWSDPAVHKKCGIQCGQECKAELEPDLLIRGERLSDFQRLFGSSGGVFGKFIQVCSDYERVEKQQADSPELPSLDSGVSSGGEEQLSQDEGMEDADKSTKSTRFLFPPHPSSALPCSLLSFPQLPLNLPGPRLSPAVQRQPGHMTQGFALTSAGRSVEPSGDGYMSVKQEEGTDSRLN
ncbi:unnamed protein product [Oreochromis niloticus]|nr:unnamed protein product [Mustela putorius furo]